MKELWIEIKALLAKYWWIIAGILLLLVGTILARGRSGQALKKWRGVQARIDQVDERKEAQIRVIEEQREERIQEIEAEHAEVVEQLKEENRDHYDELRRSPRKLNRYLNSLLPPR